MKIRKTSWIAICIAVGLVIGAVAVFVASEKESGRGREDVSVEAETSKDTGFAALNIEASGIEVSNIETAEEKQKNDILSLGFTAEEYEQLLALKLDGYEDMTVEEYRERVGAIKNNREYQDLLEKFFFHAELYEMRDTNETASFLFYILAPLTAEQWQKRDFGGYAMTDNPSWPEQAVLEYLITLSIADTHALTVREYDYARAGVMKGLQNFLGKWTKEELRDEAFMEKAVREEMDAFTQQWKTDALDVSVEYFFRPMSNWSYQNVSDGLLSGEYYWLPLIDSYEAQDKQANN